MTRRAPRFIFVDRVTGHESRTWVRAEHIISSAHALRSRPYRLLEALAQSAGWLIASSTDFTKRGLPISIESVRMLAPLPVETTILLEAEILSWREESALATARASIDGTLLAEIDRGICALIPADRLDDPEETRAMFTRLVSRAQHSATRPGGRPDAWPVALPLDGIERLDDGRRIRASWKISPAESFFPHHFPRLPVLPGALQVQASVELAASLFADRNRRPVLDRLTQVRFRGFVRPGEDLALEAAVLSRTAEQAVASAEGFVEGKRVVSLQEIHFKLEPTIAESPRDRRIHAVTSGRRPTRARS